MIALALIAVLLAICGCSFFRRGTQRLDGDAPMCFMFALGSWALAIVFALFAVLEAFRP